MIEGDERRQHKRIPYMHTLTYSIYGRTLSLPEKFLKHADIIDISSGGIRIRTLSVETNFDLDAILFLNIPMPKTPVTIPTIGKVKWIKIDKFNMRQIGIEFIKSE